jgi:hypothetical protein
MKIFKLFKKKGLQAKLFFHKDAKMTLEMKLTFILKASSKILSYHQTQKEAAIYLREKPKEHERFQTV